MKHFKKLKGKKCSLSPIAPSDAEQYCKWLNDMEVGIFLEIAHQQLSLEKEESILKQMANRGDTIFGIIDNKTEKLIGNCGLHNLDHLNRKAEFGIFIGDKKMWGRGYGTEATQLILDYGFNILNLHNIWLRVFSYNERAFRSYEKCGFKAIGRRREVKIIGGIKYDEILMDLLATEYKSIYIKKIIENKCSKK